MKLVKKTQSNYKNIMEKINKTNSEKIKDIKAL